MVLRKFNNWVLIAVIICSTGLYELSAAGSLQKFAELAGVGIIVGSMVLSAVYSREKVGQMNFILPVLLIIFSILTSMFMAYYSRDQSFGQTLYAQRAIYYYLLYFLLHQLKIRPRDLEIIFISLGLLYVLFYLLQYFAYPTILFDSYIRASRGTIRIYMPGSDYMFISFFLAIQYFFRTNRKRYLVLLLLILIILILTGGRQSLATVILVAILFLFVDKRVKSRFLISVLGLSAVVAGYFIFQGIFEALFLESKSHAQLGGNYIRFRAMDHYLTGFFKHPLAYITGNGMYNADSSYGREISYDMIKRQFYLGDIGIIGNYVIYGVFFVWGVLSICFKSLTLKIEAKYHYVKLMILTMVISLVIAGGFASSDTISFVCIMLYMIDISRSEMKKDMAVV